MLTRSSFKVLKIWTKSFRQKRWLIFKSGAYTKSFDHMNPYTGPVLQGILYTSLKWSPVDSTNK